jgi:hypothetical protein
MHSKSVEPQTFYNLVCGVYHVSVTDWSQNKQSGHQIERYSLAAGGTIMIPVGVEVNLESANMQCAQFTGNRKQTGLRSRAGRMDNGPQAKRRSTMRTIWRRGRGRSRGPGGRGARRRRQRRTTRRGGGAVALRRRRGWRGVAGTAPARETAAAHGVSWGFGAQLARPTDERTAERGSGRERGGYLLEAVEQGRGDVAQVQQEAEQRHGRPPTCVRLR